MNKVQFVKFIFFLCLTQNQKTNFFGFVHEARARFADGSEEACSKGGGASLDDDEAKVRSSLMTKSLVSGCNFM